MFLGCFVVLGFYPLEANRGTLLQLLDAIRCHCLRLPESVVVAFLLRFVGAADWVRPVIPLVSPRWSIGSHYMVVIENGEIVKDWMRFYRSSWSSRSWKKKKRKESTESLSKDYAYVLKWTFLTRNRICKKTRFPIGSPLEPSGNRGFVWMCDIYLTRVFKSTFILIKHLRIMLISLN